MKKIFLLSIVFIISIFLLTTHTHARSSAVLEKPVVGKISFSKTKYVSEDVMLSNIRTQEGEFLDDKTLKDDVGTIEELCRKKGLRQAKVEVETFFDEPTNKTNLHFIVSEGYRAKIKAINVLGNSAYHGGRIARAMKSRSTGLLNSGYLEEEVLDEDMTRIKAFYEKNGYINATAAYTVEPLDPELVNVKVTVDEGRCYYIGKVLLRGNMIVSDPEIVAKMKDIRSGKIFSRTVLNKDVEKVRSLYFDRGYIFAKVEDLIFLNPATSEVEVSLNIKEGGTICIDKIKIQGNTQTRDVVIRRELRLQPGDKFDGTKLRHSKERLRNLGFLENISFAFEDTAQPDRKNLVVDVKEAQPGSFSFGGGYSTVDRLVGFVEIEHRNFDFTNWQTFTGGGQLLSMRAELGTSRNDMLLSFTEPWLFGRALSAGFDLYRTKHSRENDTGYAYDQVRTGGKLRFGKAFSEYISASAYYRLDENRISNIDKAVSDDLKAEDGEDLISAVGLSFTNDRRDSKLNPARGWTATVSGELAGGPLAGDKDFFRLEACGSCYIPLFYNSVLQFSGRAGIVNAYGDYDKVPISERYFAGGASTIRGYEERGVGPLDANKNEALGGESLLLASVEYTIPLIDKVKFATFFDIGNVWCEAEDLASSRVYSGAGIGLRIKTPIGPMNLDYGIPLNKEPGDKHRHTDGKFYFSFSQAF